MTLFFQYLVSGLATGSIYALVALGLALIYRSTRILNFAHGDITTAGTFMAFTLLSLNLPFALAFVIAIVFGSVLAMAFYFCVLVPAQRREATQLGQIILTLGLGLILQGLVAYFGGTVPQAFPFPLSDIKIYHLGEVVVSQLSLGTFFISLFACLLFYLLVQKTRIGLAMRATSENLPAAQTMGIPTRKVLAFSWGLNSLPGAIVGGLILGVAESLAGGFISIAFKNTLAFVIIILVLLFRPEGLLGKEFKERV
jgi:branched-chain amino acid transport system permease protein